MNAYKMKPISKATWIVRINAFHVVPGSPVRYYWEVVGLNQLQRTYVHKTHAITLRQSGDSPSPQHCSGMFMRFAKINGITRYKFVRTKCEDEK